MGDTQAPPTPLLLQKQDAFSAPLWFITSSFFPLLLASSFLPLPYLIESFI
jgi:hypothetical protein